MIHFTHTGPAAGQTFCGAERNGTDRFMHPPYSATATMILLDSPDMCPDCKRIYEDAGEED